MRKPLVAALLAASAGHVVRKDAFVAAVTEGSMPEARSHATNSFIVCVLPLPDSPVRYTFAPVFNIVSASPWVIPTL